MTFRRRPKPHRVLDIHATDTGHTVDFQIRFAEDLEADVAMYLADGLDEIARDLRTRIARAMDEADQ